MKTIISFDIGIKNFACAEMDLETKDFVLLSNVSFVEDKVPKGKISKQILRNMFVHLENLRPSFYRAKKVLIEQQLSRNQKARRIQSALEDWLMIQYPKLTVIAVSSRKKTDGVKGLDYRQRKAFAVKKAQEHIGIERLKEACGKGKKDDIADCVVMCLQGVK